MEQIPKIKAKVVEIGPLFYIISEEKIKIGDEILDFEAFQNGYTDVIRKCEDEKDEEYVNQSGSGYRKIICTNFTTNWIWSENSDHEYRYDFELGGYVEPMDETVYDRIAISGGECLVMTSGEGEYLKFDGNGKIIVLC